MSISESGFTGKLITCREIAGMIPDYLEGRLSGRQLEHFLEHIRTCRNCYEELETNYMVGRTIRYLDEGMTQADSFDFRPMLENDLEVQEKEIRRKKGVRRVQFVILLFTLLLTLLLILDLTGLFSVGSLLP